MCRGHVRRRVSTSAGSADNARMEPSDPVEERFHAALTAHRQGRLEEAERHYRHVISRRPRHASAHNNLGLTFAMRGDLGEAIRCFRAALASDPGSADAAVNLAQALEQSGDGDAAMAAWRQAAALAPGDMEPALAAAVLAVRGGEVRQAVALLEDAARRQPRRADTREVLERQVDALAARLIDDGDLVEGHRLASLLVTLRPDDPLAVILLARCLRMARAGRFDAGLKGDLLVCFASDAVDHRELSRAAARIVLLEHPALAAASRAVRAAAETTGAHRDPLLLRLLWYGINADPALEAALTRLRGELVTAVDAGETLDASWRELLAALAAQCFGNEYVHAVDDEVGAAHVRLWNRAVADPPDWEAFAAAAAVQAPWRRAGAAAVAARADQAPAWVQGLVGRVLLEPMEERSLRATLDVGVVGDQVSRSVQRQYEQSPYPRWQTLERQPEATVAEYLSALLPGYAPAPALAGPVDILIAGCGTGEHALRVAARHPRCRVSAIDLSGASLAYALRKARVLGIDNVTFRLRDILALDRGEGPYQVIESVGVLHHMADPAAGLAALVRLLAPGGVIKLGLYSRPARARVNRARERIGELGLAAAPRDMRAFRQRILSGQEPDLAKLTESLDFYTLSTVRDLLFHAQEHQYDVPALRALLEGCNLRVIGFQVPPGIRRRYLERHPDDPSLANLDHWHAFERDHPDTFAAMYQLWCEIKGDAVA